MVKNQSDNETGNLLHGLFFPISSKGSFIFTILQTGIRGWVGTKKLTAARAQCLLKAPGRVQGQSPASWTGEGKLLFETHQTAKNCN